MKTFEQKTANDVSFDSIVGLTNTTFNPDQIVEGRMATEAQIVELEQRYQEVEAQRNYCCRDIVVWKTYTRIIKDGSGIVLSNFIENVNVGTTRRGYPFTVTFTPKFDENLYVPNRSAYAYNDAYRHTDGVGNFMILGTRPDRNQESRIVNECMLNNANSLKDNYTNAMRDNTTTGTGCSEVSNSALEGQMISILPGDASLPHDTSDGHYRIYMQADGTITVDVKYRSLFRGTADNNLNDPAYIALFALQLVAK